MRYLNADRAQRALVALVATAFVFGPAAAWSMGIKPEAIENRALSPAPEARKGWDALDMMSPWATDHLPGRTQAVHLNAWVDYRVLGQLPTEQQRDPHGGATPTVLQGKDGYLFYGRDFTNACDQLATYVRDLSSLARLAEIIEASGRKVVFSVAPNKSSVATDKLPDAIPRGACAASGIEQENRLLDTLHHPLYLGIRRTLAEAHASDKQVYLRTDSHWSTLGASMYAEALASRLDPELAGRLRMTPTRITKVGDLMKLIGLASPESLTSASISGAGTVLPDPKTAVFDPLRVINKPQTWISRPGKGLVQGKTLLLGDSFTYYGLASLRPLFAHGRFVWLPYVTQKQVISEIKASDTVVIEVVQRGLKNHPYTKKAFQLRVATALGVARPAG